LSPGPLSLCYVFFFLLFVSFSGKAAVGDFIM